MACRTVRLAAIAGAVIAAAAAGCRRAPLADSASRDAGADHAPSRGDTGFEPPDGGFETVAESGGEAVPPDGDDPDGGDGGAVGDAADAHDTADGQDATDAPDDRMTTADAPVDRPADGPGDVARTDTPVDVPNGDTPIDVPADMGSPDLVPTDGTDARPEDQPCGPSRFHCDPFACDVATGTCKTTCTSADDCFAHGPCIAGRCASPPETPCTSSNECSSGFCAQGRCCATACSQLCWSCAVPGFIGTCTMVPNGGLDPGNRCPAGAVCDGRAACVPPTCTVATDCGRFHACSNGRCIPCAGTCVSNADCAFGAICIDNNGCTRCGFPDAGTD